MALANCSECGKLFNQVARDVCPNCVQEEDEKFNKVRDYVKKNSRVSAQEIADETEVPLTLILRFLREGRLTVSNRSAVSYPCKSCGESIGSGQYCVACTRQLQSELSKGVKTDSVGKKVDVKSQPARSARFHSSLHKKD